MTTAIVLAGGLGTRLRSEVPDLPKPMAPIAGRPFLGYQLDYWLAQGVTRFVLSVGYRHEAIVGYFGDHYRGVPIEYAVETTPLGTGGGLLLALASLGASTDPFLVLNGDTYFEVGLKDLAAFHAARRSDWTFALFRCAQAGRYMGMGVDEQGRITALRSGSAEPGRMANGGVYLVQPQALRGLRWTAGSRVSLEDELLPSVVEAGRRLYGCESTGAFIDIGVPEDYRRAPSLLAA